MTDLPPAARRLPFWLPAPLLIFLLVLLFPALGLGAVEGVLLDRSGSPLAGIPVTLEETGETTTTATTGRFRFDVPPGEYTLLVLGRELPVAFADTNPVTVPVDIFTQSIVVNMPSLDAVTFDSKVLEPSAGATLTDILSRQPDVHQSGLGGMLATLTVGGFAKHRVQTTVNGYRVAGDRRAGSDLGTLVPSLLEGATVYRGGTGTIHGSEAVGGVLNVNLPAPNGDPARLTANLLYGENNERVMGSAVYAGPDLAISAAYDDAGPYTSGAGTEEDGDFTRANVAATRRFQGERRLTMLDVIFTRGWDIGKPSLSSTPTVYPEDILALAGVRSWGDRLDWQLGVIRQELVTEKPDERSEIESINVHGASFFRTERPDHRWRLGLEVYTRQAVDAVVRSETSESRPMDGASRWEVSPIGVYEADLPRGYELDVGLRYQHFDASSNGTSVNDGLLTGHTTVGWSGARAGDLSLGIFRSFRFPTLEELFYTGPSGRGHVYGNPDLSPEEGVGGNISWKRALGEWTLGAAFYLQDLSSYIEKVEVEEDVYTFRNVRKVRVADASLKLDWRWLAVGASWARGTDRDSGDRVDDIPPLKLAATAAPALGDFRPFLHLLLADRQDDVGPNERVVPGYAVVDLGLGWQASHWLQVQLKALNLLDRDYLPSADDKAVPAPGRSVVLSLRLTPAI